jgi:DNA mismatch endonuclease (patch repair protein)
VIKNSMTVSERMSKIRSKNTAPELHVRRLLHKLGYRYRLHQKDLPGSPDIVFKGRRKAIFIHGCFWHQHQGCKISHIPKSNRQFWQDKLERNRKRDSSNLQALHEIGWEVLIIWECEVSYPDALSKTLSSFLGFPSLRQKSGRL